MRCARCNRPVRRKHAEERPMRKIERRIDKVENLVGSMMSVADEYYPAKRRLELIEEYADNAEKACEEVKGYPATHQQLEDLEIECLRMQGAHDYLMEHKDEWWTDFGGKETGWTLQELETDLVRLGDAVEEICGLVDDVKTQRKTKP